MSVVEQTSNLTHSQKKQMSKQNYRAVLAFPAFVGGFSVVVSAPVAAQTTERPAGIRGLFAGGTGERLVAAPGPDLAAEARESKTRQLREQGHALYVAGKLSEAAKRFEEALHLRPDTVGLFPDLADIYQRAGRTQDALHLYGLQVDRWKDKNPKMLLTYAQLLIQAKQSQEAVAPYHEALSGLPRNDNLPVPLEQRFDNSFVPTPHLEAAIETGLGMLEYQRGYFEKALLHLRRATALYPKFATPQYYLGATLRESPQESDQVSANQALQKAVENGTPTIRSAVIKLTTRP